MCVLASQCNLLTSNTGTRPQFVTTLGLRSPQGEMGGENWLVCLRNMMLILLATLQNAYLDVILVVNSLFGSSGGKCIHSHSLSLTTHIDKSVHKTVDCIHIFIGGH